MPPSLDALIHPRTRPEFFASYRTHAPFVVHGPRPALAAITGLPLLASLDALLRAWPDQVQAHLPDVADEASSIAVSPRDARKLFATGMGLLFDDVHTTTPELGPWLAALRRDLGLSALTQGRCLVYATPHGKGTAPHFDQNVNFVLQLHGTKTWRLAPNRHVDHPLTRHTMGLAVDPELQTYARTPMPETMADTMPADGQTIVLEPGSLLFVPRGVWHATEATGDALALNFTFTAPTWLELFAAALRGRLAMSEAWRATAAPAAAADFEALLRELADDAQHWTAEEILGVTEGVPPGADD